MTTDYSGEFSGGSSLADGRVYLNTSILKKNRRRLGMSQMGLAEYSAAVRQPISIASIKRAELGKPVIYRTALQLAKLFKEDVSALVIDTVSPSHVLSTDDPSASHTPLKMVGRDGEFKYINYLLQETQSQSIGRFIYVRGVAGIGKTRLLEEVSAEAHAKKFKLLQCKFYDSMNGQGMSTLVPLIQGCLGLDVSGEIDISARTIQSQLKSHGVTDDTHIYIANVLGLDLSPQDLEIYNSLSHEARTNKIQQALVKTIHIAAKNRHWLMVIDDVHWASEYILNLLAKIICECRDSAVAWIMASRLENDPLESKIRPCLIEQSVNIVEITPLSLQESKILANCIQSDLTENQFLAVEKAKGNPLFVTQLLFNGADSILPSSLLEIVDYKLNLLGEQDLKAMQMAAAMQREMDLATLRELLGDFNYLPIMPMKLKIIRAVGENKFSYTHDLVMRGVYDRTEKNKLKILHEKIAEYFEGKDGKIQAIHLIKAKSSMAPKVMLEAIQEKYAKFSFIEALELLQVYNAIDFAPIDAFEALQLEGLVLSAIGRSKDAKDSFERALVSTAHINNQLRVVVELARVMNVLDDLIAEEALLESYIPQARAVNDGRILGQLLYLQGNLYFPRGDHQTARKLHLAARDVASRAKDARTEALSLSGLGDSYYAQGRMHSATQIFKECLSICEQYGLKHVESSNRFMLATTRLYLNETNEALADALASANLAAKVGNLRAEIVSRLTVGWLHTSLGEIADALDHYDAAMKVIYAIGAKRFEPFILEGMAKCHFINGQQDKALKTIQKAWQLIQDQSLYKFIGPWVLGTLATIEQDEHLRQKALDRGLEIIQTGCLAHNHYRFYLAAAESHILSRNAAQASIMADQLEAFTAEEPCAWANHHIDLIRLHVRDLLNPFSQRSSQTSNHIQLGRVAGLVGVSPVLHGVLTLA